MNKNMTVRLPRLSLSCCLPVSTYRAGGSQRVPAMPAIALFAGHPHKRIEIADHKSESAVD